MEGLLQWKKSEKRFELTTDALYLSLEAISKTEEPHVLSAWLGTQNYGQHSQSSHLLPPPLMEHGPVESERTNQTGFFGHNITPSFRMFLDPLGRVSDAH
jgi:hypothetical protein